MLDDIVCEAEYPYLAVRGGVRRRMGVEAAARARKPRVRRRGLRAFRIRRSPTLES